KDDATAMLAKVREYSGHPQMQYLGSGIVRLLVDQRSSGGPKASICILARIYYALQILMQRFNLTGPCAEAKNPLPGLKRFGLNLEGVGGGLCSAANRTKF